MKTFRNTHTFSAVLVLLCFVSVAALGACGKKEGPAPEKIFNVETAKATKTDQRPFIEATGTLNPFEEVIVSAEIEGIVRAVKVTEGSVVRKGTLLASIDDKEFRFEALRADAALKQAQANLANTKIEFSRKEALYKEELVTKQQFDDVSTRLIVAEAEVERSKAALAIAREKLSKTTIVAPLSSSVKEKKVSAGDFVKNGTAMLVLIQPDPLKVKFSVPEREVGKLARGQDVTVRVDAFGHRDFSGRLNTIYPASEEKTRSLFVEALIPNTDGALKPGLFARVLLYTAAPRPTILVPITSLLYEGEKVRLFITEGDRARVRSVTTGLKYGEMMEITDGIQEGDNVVIAGQQSLADGVKVAGQNRGTDRDRTPKPAPLPAGTPRPKP